MRTIRKFGSTRYFFFSNEGDEPPHVHVEDGEALAEFWLQPVAFMSSHKFPNHKLRKIERGVRTNQLLFLKAWHEHFGT
ncbi:MAG: DUF4160 domain-containing protein [Planctomycetes bacterium]|nr:DUF4160 domain-containing protein [Planctomycetota bacterium]